MRHERSLTVNRPIDELWAIMKDLPFQAPRVGGWLLRLRPTSPGPIGLGWTWVQRVVILGVETRISGVITEFNPPHSLTFSLTGGAGIRSGSIRATMEETAHGTRIAMATEIEPRPAFKPLWWIAGPFLRRRWDATIPNLKRLLETGPG